MNFYTITAPNCVITSGNSSCSTTVGWNTSNADNAAVISSRKIGLNWEISIISTNLSGSLSRTISYGIPVNFSLKTDAMEISSATATASCHPTTVWNGSICITSTPTDVEVYANNVRPKYTTTSGSNIWLKWRANGFPDISRVTCKLETLEGGSVVQAKTVRGLPYAKDPYPTTGYINPAPTINTTYRVTCSDDILTWMGSDGCTILTAGEVSCTSEVNWELDNTKSVFSENGDLEVWSLSSMLSNITADGDSVQTFVEDTYHSADGSTNDVRMLLKTGGNASRILVDSIRPIATCNPATLYHVPGMQQCISWDQYFTYLSCRDQHYIDCQNQAESCYISHCAPYTQQ